MEYAKLDNGCLRRLLRVPNVSNPAPETLAAYAAKHGFKPLENTASPGPYHTLSYTDRGGSIVQEWTPLPLADAQTRAMEELQQKLNYALSHRVAIPCALGFDIIYDQDALINAVGMQTTGGCAAYIAADDTTHTLDTEAVQAVVHALESHRTALYTAAQQTRYALQHAATTAEVETILQNLSL